LNTEEIIAQIDEEISKLQQAKTLLVGNVGVKPNRVGRPKKSITVSRILSVEPAKRVMSAECRARIAAAQKLRWAKTKRADRKAAKKAAVKSVPAKRATAKKVVVKKAAPAIKPPAIKA
jgi:hypothetical protein